MAGYRQVLRIFLNNSCSPYICARRFLNYTPLCYDGIQDPAPLFFNKEVQAHLRALTRADYNRIFKRKKLGSETLSDPEYKFMTDAELQQSLREAEEKADELLQIPPVVKVQNQTPRVLSKDPALQGLNTSRIVFTDITYGIKDSERIIVVREPDGTLQEAEWNLRQRVNQTYFPLPGKHVKKPKMFDGVYLENLLDRNECEFVLDRACIEFEPEDPEFQRIASIVYQHVNENNQFDLLRSTRHFGGLTFFLVWNKNIDNLLLELIETLHVDEGRELVSLYSLMHKIQFNGDSDLDVIGDYIKKAGNKKAALELAVQAYKDITSQRQNVSEIAQ